MKILKQKNVSIFELFFQSSLILRGIEKEVCEFFEFKDDVVNRITERVQRGFTKPVIVIGCRLGDFLQHGDFFQIPFNWYTKALVQEFPDWQTNYNVLVLSDDINKAKEIFKKRLFFFTMQILMTPLLTGRISNIIMEMLTNNGLLGTLSSGMIISNSTFSLAQTHIRLYVRKVQRLYTAERYSEGKAKQKETSLMLSSFMGKT